MSVPFTMKKSIYAYIILICSIVWSSCSVNKFIPENHYLLDDVKIISETKEVQPELFSTYIRQNPNAKWFNLVKVSIACQDAILQNPLIVSCANWETNL